MRQRLFVLGITLAASVLAGCNTTAPQHSSQLDSLARLSTEAPAYRALDIQRWQTPAGTNVLFVHTDELPMYDLRLTFAAGSSRDGQAHGLANLTNTLIGSGTDSLNADQIAQRFEGLGARFGQGSYRDMAVLSLRTLSDPQLSQPAVDLFTQVITQPSYPEHALVRVKNQLLAGFAQQQKVPGHLANRALFTQLYGTHPYAHNSSGTEQSVPKLSRTMLHDFHQRYYSAQNAQLAIVGDLSRQEAEQIAQTITSKLPQHPAAPVVATPKAPAATQEHIEFAAQQTHILLAHLGIERGHPDYAALFIANQIFGGSGFGSRLMEEVREKRGLTYGIYSHVSPMQAQGPFMISVQTRAELSQATLEFTQQLLREFVKHGASEQELASAKQEFLGSFPLSAASNAAIVGQLGAIGFYDLPLQWMEELMQEVQTLSLEQLNAAIRQHFKPEELVVITVGPSTAQLPLPDPVKRAPAPAEYRH